tara:strand:- start:5384 stop:6157 length:774 start_codon:yes stop_codon:yes gene_type:complete
MTTYKEVTELSGDEVTEEQVQRIFHRYVWAVNKSKDLDVLEVACGTGQGLGALLKVAKSLDAGDYSDQILDIARNYYKDRIELKQFDAQSMPYETNSKDLIIIYEALYYIPSIETFISECKRVLRKNGKVLVATANRDLEDFNPSPHSFEYLGVEGLNNVFSSQGFSCSFFGYLEIDQISWRQKVLRPIKKLVVNLRLMPKTMAGKKILKRLVFGKLIKMPFEIIGNEFEYEEPHQISQIKPNTDYKVIYCEARLNN